MNRNRVVTILAGAGAVISVVVVVLWLLLHTMVRTWYWDTVSERPLDEAELASIARCEPPSWLTWLKVLTRDLEITCGEAWVATDLADKLSTDRARWIETRVADPNVTPGLRMRGAMALLVSGRPAPDEPAWLAEQLTPTREAMWIRAAAESDAIAVHVGPRLAGLGMSARVRLGTVTPVASVPLYEWLSLVDDPLAETETVLTTTRLASVYTELVTEIRSRLAAGRPIGGAAARWVAVVRAHPECEPRCAQLWTEVLERSLTDSAFETGEALPPDPEEHSRVAQILTTIGASTSERRGVAYAIGAMADWVKASPDPGARLRSFVARPAGPAASVARVMWDGVAPPYLAAVIVQAVGDRAEVAVDVRVGDQGELWFRIDGIDVVRTCSEAAPVPDAAPWPPDAVLAGALAELANDAAESEQLMRGLKLATAAERLDPLVAGPLAVRLASGAPPELEAGRRIGVSLLRPVSPPNGADASRRRVGEKGPVSCR